MEIIPADMMSVIFDMLDFVTVVKLRSVSKNFTNISIGPLLEKIQKEIGDSSNHSKCITEIFFSLNANKIIFANKIFLYNEKQTLYEEIPPRFLDKVSYFLRSLLKILWGISRSRGNEITTNVKIMPLRYLVKKLSVNAFKNIIKSNIYTEIKNDNMFIKKINGNDDVANFQNGIVCLKTGKFRKRTHVDYYTECLNYDYTEEPDTELLNKINRMLLTLCNNDNKCCLMIKEWLGYCLTGNIDEKTALIISDDEYLDGIRHIIDMFIKMYRIYAEDIDLSNDSLRYFPSYLKHCRFLFIEKSHMGIFNQTVTGELTNEDVLVGQLFDYNPAHIKKSILKKSILKVNILNFDHNHCDHHASQSTYRGFAITPDNVCASQTNMSTFIPDQNLIDNMRRDDHKLALFHILLPYSIQYYQKGLLNYHKFETTWKQMCSNKPSF